METKYRAYHKEEKKMCELSLINFNVGAFLLGLEPEPEDLIEIGEKVYKRESPKDGRFCNEDEYILMQYTGLEDKNGKEIYFGDILVTSNDGADGADVWSAEDFGITVVKEPEGVLGVDYTEWDMGSRDEQSIYSGQYVEIIGNIYENPELLD